MNTEIEQQEVDENDKGLDQFVNREQSDLSFFEKITNVEPEEETDPPPEADSPQETDSETEPPQEAETDDPAQDAEPDPKEKERFQYWQSKHDKVKAENEKLKEKLGTASEYSDDVLEIAGLIKKHPQALDVLQKAMNGEPVGPAAEAQPPQKPTRPTKPANYNRYDAINDPESESAKYQDALEDYHLKRDEYDDYMAEMTVKQRKEAEKRQKQMQLQQQQQQEVIRTLKYEHNLNDKEVDDFIQFASAPNPSLEDLVELYRLRSGKKPGDAAVRQKAEELKQKQALRKKNPPPPNGTQGSDNKSFSFFGKKHSR